MCAGGGWWTDRIAKHGIVARYYTVGQGKNLHGKEIFLHWFRNSRYVLSLNLADKHLSLQDKLLTIVNLIICFDQELFFISYFIFKVQIIRKNCYHYFSNSIRVSRSMFICSTKLKTRTHTLSKRLDWWNLPRSDRQQTIIIFWDEKYEHAITVQITQHPDSDGRPKCAAFVAHFWPNHKHLQLGA